MNIESHERPFTRTTFLITGGLLIWIANFVFVYVFAALACARASQTSACLASASCRVTTTLATILAGAATAWLFWFTRSSAYCSRRR